MITKDGKRLGMLLQEMELFLIIYRMSEIVNDPDRRCTCTKEDITKGDLCLFCRVNDMLGEYQLLIKCIHTDKEEDV